MVATAETAQAPKKPRARKQTGGTTSPPKAKRTVDAEHKKAMAVGRDEARTVRKYLEALETHKPKRGRKVTPDSLRARLAKVEEELKGDVNPLQRLLLNQEEKDLKEQIESFAPEGTVDLSELEAGFIRVGKSFAKRKKIDRSTFKGLGVKPEVLKKAGI